MWAVVATIFVFRYSHEESVSAALSRISATLLSFALCFVYLLIFPFRPWGMAVLIGIGAIVLALIRRSGDIITPCITITVVLIVTGINPQHAWKQQILRLIDTIVCILVVIVDTSSTTTLDPHILSRSQVELRQRHEANIS